jgi:glycosyltransferase involved in cell wall biosynthesis
LFLLPSEYESFGLAALEAMGCEVPVISTNAGGLPEINVHGETGYLTEVGDTDAMAGYVMELFTNDEKLKQFKQNALKQANRFKIADIIPMYEALYEKVLKEK